jgi:Tol biopolymer transport system component
VKGVPVRVVEGVRRAQSPVTGAADFSVSRSGTLAYIPGPVLASTAEREIVLANRKGEVEVAAVRPGPYVGLRVSPDGRRLAVGTDDGKEAIVWVHDLSGTSAMRRITFAGNNRFPTWSADSQRITFQSDRDGDPAIFWQAVDGAGTADRLTGPERGASHVPESWSPKGDRLLFSVITGRGAALWTLTLQDRNAVHFTGLQSLNPAGAVFSPDGRWVAYADVERGRPTIFVQPFPATGAKYQLVTKGPGAHQPLWSPDGRELIYNPAPGVLEAVPVTTLPTFAFGNPLAVPRPFQTGPPEVRRPFDITPSGRLVGLTAAGATASGVTASPQVHIILNWFEELTRRVPIQ